MRWSTVLHDARTRRAVSQTEWARRSGVGQGRISEYLAGVREPTLEIVRRLLGALDLQLAVTVTDSRTVDRAAALRRGREIADLLELADALPSRPWRRPTPPPWSQLMHPHHHPDGPPS